MKYIKLYEDFFGNDLWNDVTYPQRSRGLGSSYQERTFVDYITRMYNNYEKNTSKEDKLLNAIEVYLSEGDRDIIHNKGLLQKLLKYKKLYPEMLDPGLNNRDMVFRGMTMDWDEVHNLIDSCDRIVKMQSMKYLLLKGAKTIVTSRQDIGFISASTSLQTASNFQQMEDWRWPIIAAAPFGKIEKKSIMNPDFLNTLNPMDESEIWILGNKIEAQDVYLQVFNPEFYPHQMKRDPDYAKILTRIWGIYDDNRTKKR
tara:strand:- start:655 stop:1425 length:771 start_codon:yes stop_codon:yes gene_type:complete